MEQNRYMDLVNKMASEKDPIKKAEYAFQIIINTSDVKLRSEINNFAITMGTAKDSVEQEKVMEACNLYVKKQLAMIFSQAFEEGQKFQHNLSIKAIHQMQEDEKKGIETVIAEDIPTEEE